MKLTTRGRRLANIVAFTFVLGAAWLLATVPANWWSDSPLPIR